jgi:hypothetical protein
MKSLVLLVSHGMENGKNSPATPKDAETYPHGFLYIFRN